MPSISGGGGFIPPPIQPPRPVQQAAAAQAEQAQTQLAPKDTVKVSAAPTQTSLTSQTAQRLTSDTTRAQIHQLIQTAQPQVPTDKPQLQMMQRPAMSSALADTLAQHHVPDQTSPQQTAQQNSQQTAQQNLNQQAAQQASVAAGQYQTSTLVRPREHTKDSSDRNTLQSGQRVRKQEKDGEFSSLDDFGGGEGMSGNQSGQDQRSDSQKKKQILSLEEKRKGPPGAKPPPPPQVKAGAAMTGMSPHFKAATGPIGQPKPAVVQPPKPAGTTKPAIQRVQPPLGQQPKPAPPKKANDEWSL